MREEDTLTAEVYGVWLLHTMNKLKEGEDFDRLQSALEGLCDDLQHLEKCLSLPAFERDNA